MLQPLPSPMLTPEQRWRRKCTVVLISLLIAVGLVLESKSRKLLLAVSQPTDAHWTAAEHSVHGIGLSALILLSVLAFIYPRIFSGTKAVARFIDDPGAEAARGSMTSVRKQLGKLVDSATRGERRLIIFVDDLERCRPPRAVEVCEVASQLLDHDNIVTVLVADMHVIAMSAAIKYRGLELPVADQSDNARAAYAQYGREYLQKLVQIQFDLPPAGSGQLKELLKCVQHDSEEKGSPLWFPVRRLLNLPIAGPFVALISVAALGLLPEDMTVVAPLVATAGIAGLIRTRIAEVSEKRRSRQDRDRADDKISKVFEEDQRQGQGQGETVYQMADKAAEGEDESKKELYQQRTIYKFLKELAENKVMLESDELVYEYLPDRPRAAKRLLNQVRLTIVIALHRGLIRSRDVDDQRENAKRIAKWVILQERWPELALAAYSDVKAIARLEGLARNGGVDGLKIQLKGCDVSDIEDLLGLWKFLRSLPDLGDLRQLITLGGSTAQGPVMA